MSIYQIENKNGKPKFEKLQNLFCLLKYRLEHSVGTWNTTVHPVFLHFTLSENSNNPHKSRTLNILASFMNGHCPTN